MQCATCNSPLSTIPAGVSKKTGKPYSSFQSCPNRCKQPYNPTPNASGSPTTQQNGWQVVVEHLAALEDKVDAMANLLKEQLGG